MRKEDTNNSNRSDLLGKEGLKRRRERKTTLNSNNDTASEAAEIQRSLNRTQGLLQSQLLHVTHVASAIDDDGKVLRKTMDEHQTMNASGAKSALSNLQRAQQKEQRYLIASIVFFSAVVVYIFGARVIMHLPFVDTILLSFKSLM